MPAVADPPRPLRQPPVASRRSVLLTAVQAVVLLLLLTVLAAVVLVLFAFASLLNAPNQVAGGVSGVTTQAAHVVSGAQQALQNATDPNHPPSGLSYDTEFSTLTSWHVGDRLPDASQYVLTLQSIQRRQGADSPDTALYAVVHAELRQPRETRLLGQLIRSDSDPHDYVLYKGESFRIGSALYRVNWISNEQAAMAAGTYRNPDAVSAPLKFAYD
jgi:hypothetical protein